MHKSVSINLNIAKLLYKDFEDQLKSKEFSENKELLNLILSIPDFKIKHIFQTIYDFNRSVMATNFYCSKKASIAYRLNPEKLIDLNVYPEIP